MKESPTSPAISYNEFDIQDVLDIVVKRQEGVGAGEGLEFIEALRNNECFDKQTDNTMKKDGLLSRIEAEVRKVKSKEDFEGLMNRLEKALGFSYTTEGIESKTNSVIDKAIQGILEKEYQESFKDSGLSEEDAKKQSKNNFYKLLSNVVKEVEEELSKKTVNAAKIEANEEAEKNIAAANNIGF